ncbi:ankyrin repeat domain-containing protein [Helicobacter magdeburgensis]|uniref:Ankyrin repeat domain-containing protein n=1 Tax=Helicobacter magdeburgensis TaxID=471858 RepID=A0A4U8SXR4_9HELI|nr:ankyrin repeat domain-containing protein [Helicobacter magdeburgensis]TLD91578.1 ankyrin repeat domain-containing protein [Helicobacter magdeburgensis]
MLHRYIFISLCAFEFAFGGWFVESWSLEDPPTLEQSLNALLEVDCKKVELLKGITPKSHYKGSEAVKECEIEQKLLRVIIEDDAQDYQKMLDNNQWSRYFLFYTTQSPRLEITPLMVSIVFDSYNVFELILAESGRVDLLTKDKPRFNINRMMLDDYSSLGAFQLQDRIFDVNGVSALDLAAMYHRYGMFWEILKKGAEYNNRKHPNSNGIVTFGDSHILELMLYFDESFLRDFGGGNMLHFVARDGNMELLEYLIKEKQVPIDSLKAGETPLDVALNAKNFQKKPQIEIAKKLIELGATPSEANERRLKRLLQKEQ